MPNCQSCQERDRIEQGRTVRSFRQRERQRNQDDQARIEEHRHRDDQTRNTKRPGRFLIAEPPYHAYRQRLRAA